MRRTRRRFRLLCTTFCLFLFLFCFGGFLNNTRTIWLLAFFVVVVCLFLGGFFHCKLIFFKDVWLDGFWFVCFLDWQDKYPTCPLPTPPPSVPPSLWLEWVSTLVVTRQKLKGGCGTPDLICARLRDLMDCFCYCCCLFCFDFWRNGQFSRSAWLARPNARLNEVHLPCCADLNTDKESERIVVIKWKIKTGRLEAWNVWLHILPWLNVRF